MPILLDTNAFIWLVEDDAQLGPLARKHIIAADEVYVSSISVVEIHIKTMLGKLDKVGDPARDALAANLIVKDFPAQAADAVLKLPELARHDPFDRMLLAQAITTGSTFITADRTLLALGHSFIVDART